MAQERAERSPLHAPHPVTQSRRVSACMESNDIWNLCFFSRQHCQRWNERMASLAMHEVPTTLPNNRKNFGRDAVIPLRRPGAHPNDAHSLDHFFLWQRSIRAVWGSCKNCDVDASARETTPYFINVCFNAPYIAEVSRSHH